MYAGVLLSISALLGGSWRKMSETQFLDSFNSSLEFIPKIVSPLMFASLIGLLGSIVTNKNNQTSMKLWLYAGGCMFLMLFFTAIWFGPTNGLFMSKSLPSGKVLPKMRQWLMLHNVRIFLVIVAATFSVLATKK